MFGSFLALCHHYLSLVLREFLSELVSPYFKIETVRILKMLRVESYKAFIIKHIVTFKEYLLLIL